MVKKTAIALFSGFIGLTLALSPMAAGATATVVPGVLVAESINELPAPSVALADDGRALVVWSDSGPGNPDGDCTVDGGSCNIVGAIVEADGTTVGDTFMISGDVVVDYYYAAPNVLWNDELGEWLVLFTSYETGMNGVYAQRISADGDLTGSLVPLPVDQTTSIDDRSTIVTLPNPSSIVSATATWSSTDQAYLVTWLQDGNNTGIGLANGRSLFGYFMDADLDPADGVEATFPLSDNGDAIWSGLVKHEYSPALDEWSVIWVKNNRRYEVRLTTVSYDAGEITAPASTVAVDVSGAGLNYDDYQMSGDIVWVESIEKWILTWGGVPVAGDVWNGYGRTIDADGTLGDPTQVTDFSETRLGTPSTWMPSHQLYFDEATGMVYTSGTVASFDEALDETVYTAAVWTFNPETLEAGEWFSLIASREESMHSSSRAIISGTDGGLAVVYQNWPNGSWEDPAEVRYYLLTEPGLANTGPEGASSMFVLALLAVGVGVVATTTARFRAQR